jgi:hypothetical protein
MARSRAAAAEATAKAQANAQRVADMNAERTSTELTRTAAIQYLQTHGIYSGHSRDSVEQLRQLVAEHKAGPKAPAMTDPLTDAEKAQLAKLDAEAAGPELLPDGPERVAAAKAEHKVLQAWIKDGEQPPRPATPNLDAMNADYAAGKTAADRRREAKGTKAKGGTRQRVELGTLPTGAKEGTCRTCQQVLPATRFPKAVVDGKRQPDQRADECRSCRDARRHGTTEAPQAAASAA